MNTRSALLRVVAVGAALFVFGPIAAAPAAPTGDRPARANAARPGGDQDLYAQLGLTDEQKAQIKTATEDAATQIKALKEDKTIPEDQKRPKYQAILAARDAAISQILTADQRQKLADLRLQQQAHQQAQAFDKSLEGITLTDDQSTKIEAAYLDADKQIQALHADTTLQGRDLQAKIQGVTTQRDQAVRQILTPDQQQKWDDLLLQRRVKQETNAAIASLGQGVNVTDDETSKIQDIEADKIKQLSALEQDQTLKPRDRGAKQQEIQQATADKILAVLTPDQQTVVKNNQIAKRGKEAANELVRMVDKAATLTDDEKAKVEPIAADSGSKVAAVELDSTLQRADREQKVMAIRADYLTQVKALLTPDQQQKLDAATAPRGHTERPAGERKQPANATR